MWLKLLHLCNTQEYKNTQGAVNYLTIQRHVGQPIWYCIVSIQGKGTLEGTSSRFLAHWALDYVLSTIRASKRTNSDERWWTTRPLRQPKAWMEKNVLITFFHFFFFYHPLKRTFFQTISKSSYSLSCWSYEIYKILFIFQFSFSDFLSGNLISVTQTLSWSLSLHQ